MLGRVSVPYSSDFIVWYAKRSTQIPCTHSNTQTPLQKNWGHHRPACPGTSAPGHHHPTQCAAPVSRGCGPWTQPAETGPADSVSAKPRLVDSASEVLTGVFNRRPLFHEAHGLKFILTVNSSAQSASAWLRRQTHSVSCSSHIAILGYMDEAVNPTRKLVYAANVAMCGELVRCKNTSPSMLIGKIMNQRNGPLHSIG